MESLRLPFIIIFFLLFLPNAKAIAIEIFATGGWNETINATDLIAGAGSDLISTYTSAENDTTLNITKARGKDYYWRVDIRRSGTNWPPGFNLYARRKSDGTGYGSISGGTTYIPISATDQTFFNGSENRSGINCQYQLSGMSINIPPGTYITNIIYTVVGIIKEKD